MKENQTAERITDAMQAYAAGFAEGLLVKGLTKEDEEKAIQRQITLIGLAGVQAEEQLGLMAESTTEDQQALIEITKVAIRAAFELARKEQEKKNA